MDAEEWLERGNELDDLGQYEQAVASYDKALSIQPDLHEAWYSRGIALYDLGQYEQAVASYDQALSIKPDLHEAWNNRGIALYDLGQYEQALASYNQALSIKPDDHKALLNRGDVLDNLGQHEQAVASLDQALSIKPDYHEAWYNRGVALNNLGQYEQALASYDQALSIKPDLHEAWYNRGVALDNLGQYEQALASYDQALSIKPDLHEAWNNRGNALDNLGQSEQAVDSYDQALSIKPDLHEAWNGRGVAAGNSDGRDKFLFPPSSIARQHPALNQRGYEGRLASYEQGLKHCPQDTHPEGWGLLHYAIGYAHYYRGRGDSRPRPYWHKALNSYKEALKALTEEAFPEEHLEVLQSLIKLYDYLGDTENRQSVLAKGTVVLEGLLEKTASDAVKIRLSRKFGSFAQFYVDQLVQQGDLCGALEFAEQRKNLCLTWMRNIWSKSTYSPNYAQMQQLLQPAAIQFSRGKDGQIYVTLPTGRQFVSYRAIVYWHISPAAITTFILRYNQPLIVVNGERSSFHQQIEFEKWLETWKKSKNLQAEMPELLEKLAKILNIEAILSHLKGINQLILIPHRDLHLLPLHTLFNLPSPLVGEGQGVRGNLVVGEGHIERKNFTISYLPSIKVGCDRIHSTLNTSLLSIENPTKDLPNALPESGTICQLYPNAHRLTESNATKAAVKTALAQNFGIFHFTGHSQHNLKQPEQSALILANNERLTLKDILELDLSSYNLACLSSCETNFTSKDGLIDEFIGLASGFVAAGVNNVIGSLWKVNDCSTAYLMTKFHEILKISNNSDVPSALKEAQEWLRNATNTEIDQFTLERNLTRDQGFVRNWGSSSQEEKSPDHKPYESPYYWAGFCAIGL